LAIAQWSYSNRAAQKKIKNAVIGIFYSLPSYEISKYFSWKFSKKVTWLSFFFKKNYKKSILKFHDQEVNTNSNHHRFENSKNSF